MICETCRLWTGRSDTHNECPIRTNLVCRRCCGSGHSTAECTHRNVIYPTCLEDLIPQDTKDRFSITTHTEYNPVNLNAMTHDVNRVDIINHDKWIRDFMKHKHLPTARKREENLNRIFDWAAGSGMTVRIINQEM